MRTDDDLDKVEEEDNVHVLYAINTVRLQLKATDPELLAKESAKDPVISTVICSKWLERRKWNFSKRTSHGLK